VRLAMVGCREVGVPDPKSARNLVVYVEIDRCATDAIQSVTGCKLGKRTLKFVDYGKMAATFLNTDTGRAVRVVAREESRELASLYVPSGTGKKEAQLQAYRLMPDDELFVIIPVRVQLAEQDRPGHPVSRVMCDECGEGVNDRREVRQMGRILCRACAFGPYHELLQPTTPARPVRIETA
jgi:formylmethanofuran dehydrogenase subunit E